MRTSARITASIASGALAFLLAACGGGNSQGGSTAHGSSTATKQTAPTSTTLPHTGGVPSKPVCEVISKETVERVIGKKVYSASDVDVLAGEQPTLCYYYTDTNQVKGVEIQWMTSEDARWNEYYDTPGTSAGGDTVRTRIPSLGDGAYREVGKIDDMKVVGYNVLLWSRDTVLSVYDTSGLPDVTVLRVTKAAVQAVDKL